VDARGSAGFFSVSAVFVLSFAVFAASPSVPMMMRQ